MCDFSLDYNIDQCNPLPPPTKKGNKAVIIADKAVIIAISVVVPVIAIGALVLVYLIWRWKTKSNGAYVLRFLFSLFDLY